jgi:hypothetical protein
MADITREGDWEGGPGEWLFGEFYIQGWAEQEIGCFAFFSLYGPTFEDDDGSIEDGFIGVYDSLAEAKAAAEAMSKH